MDMLEVGKQIIEIQKEQIEKLNKELALYKKALDIACDEYYTTDCCLHFMDDKQWKMTEDEILKVTKEYFLQQAKEKIDEQEKQKV